MGKVERGEGWRDFEMDFDMLGCLARGIRGRSRFGRVGGTLPTPRAWSIEWKESIFLLVSDTSGEKENRNLCSCLVCKNE